MVRRTMVKDIPNVFSGTVEVDETYLGGQWKNKKKAQRKAKRGRGTQKTPVFGILCRGGKVWAEVVQDVEAGTLVPLIKKGLSWVPPYALIPGKAIPGLLRKDIFTDW
jgi:hypothetical protein